MPPKKQHLKPLPAGLAPMSALAADLQPQMSLRRRKFKTPPPTASQDDAEIDVESVGPNETIQSAATSTPPTPAEFQPPPPVAAPLQWPLPQRVRPVAPPRSAQAASPLPLVLKSRSGPSTTASSQAQRRPRAALDDESASLLVATSSIPVAAESAGDDYRPDSEEENQSDDEIVGLNDPPLKSKQPHKKSAHASSTKLAPTATTKPSAFRSEPGPSSARSKRSGAAVTQQLVAPTDPGTGSSSVHTQGTVAAAAQRSAKPTDPGTGLNPPRPKPKAAAPAVPAAAAPTATDDIELDSDKLTSFVGNSGKTYLVLLDTQESRKLAEATHDRFRQVNPRYMPGIPRVAPHHHQKSMRAFDDRKASWRERQM